MASRQAAVTTPGSAVRRDSGPVRGHLPAEHTAPRLHFHHHWDECQTHTGYAPRHTEQSPHTSKHEPSCEPRRWGTFRRHPAPVPGAPWHLGPVLGPALALSHPHGERHSTATGPSMSLVKVKCCLPQPFPILEEFLAFSLRSTNTGFASIKFSHVTVGVLSFMLKPHSPPSPAVFPARAPRVRWCSRAAARGATTPPQLGAQLGAPDGRVPDLRHQGWQAALEEGLREDQVFKQVLIVQLPGHLELL